MIDLFPLLQQIKPALETPPAPDAEWAVIGLDSLDLAELAARIEQRYRLEIPDEDWRGIRNAAQLSAYLHDRLNNHE